MISYTDLTPGEQVVRAWWRVSLREGFDILGKPWPEKVELWRTRVNAGGVPFPLVASPAATTTDPVFGAGVAVVDVHVLGAEPGQSVSALAVALDTLVRGVDITNVQQVSNSDPTGRAAALTQRQEDASKRNPIDQLTRLLKLAITLIVVGAVAYVGVSLIRSSRK